MDTTIGCVRFRGCLVIIIMALFFIMTHASVAQAQPKHYSKVAAAGASFLGPGGWYDSDVSVEIVKPNNTVWLRYLVTVGNVRFEGQGFIPTDAFKIVGQSGSAFLETDTTTIPEFSAFRCVTNSDGSYECAPDLGGLIRMEWTGNGAYREEDLLHRRMFSALQSGPSIQNDTTWLVSANAKGVILGYEFETPAYDPQAATVSGGSDRY